MYSLLRCIAPPVGLGKNCPRRLAYKVCNFRASIRHTLPCPKRKHSTHSLPGLGMMTPHLSFLPSCPAPHSNLLDALVSRLISPPLQLAGERQPSEAVHTKLSGWALRVGVGCWVGAGGQALPVPRKQLSYLALPPGSQGWANGQTGWRPRAPEEEGLGTHRPGAAAPPSLKSPTARGFLVPVGGEDRGSRGPKAGPPASPLDGSTQLRLGTLGGGSQPGADVPARKKLSLFSPGWPEPDRVSGTPSRSYRQVSTGVEVRLQAWWPVRLGRHSYQPLDTSLDLEPCPVGWPRPCPWGAIRRVQEWL